MDFKKEEPIAGACDLVNAMRGVAVNPADTKVRDGRLGDVSSYGARVIVAVGRDVSLFRRAMSFIPEACTGQELMQNCMSRRTACRAQPPTLTFAEAAALPLASLTAWELLFDCLGVTPGKPHDAGALLIIGGTGGVGSILIQFARRRTGLLVIAKASRPESRYAMVPIYWRTPIDRSLQVDDQR